MALLWTLLQHTHTGAQRTRFEWFSDIRGTVVYQEHINVHGGPATVSKEKNVTTSISASWGTVITDPHSNH